jgi:hypothetical protein
MKRIFLWGLLAPFAVSSAVVFSFAILVTRAEQPTAFAGAPSMPHHNVQPAPQDVRRSQPIDRDRVIQGESVTFTGRGFEPAEITRGPGKFVLNINNSTGSTEVSFWLTREGGSPVREARIEKGKLSWRQILNLPPGRYSLAESSRPERVCRIVITN